MEIKACIFDLDGTLLNTLTTITYYVNAALRREGADEISEEICRGLIGKGARNLLSRALSHVGHSVSDFETFFCAYDAQYNAAPDYLTEPYGGICNLLCALKAKGMRIAVLSNKPEGAVRPLVEKFFDANVDVLAGGKEGVPLKPDPAAVAPVLDMLGVLAEETAFIGDSGVDMQTAKKYGAGLGIGVLWGYRDKDELVSCGADRLVSEPKDILSILGF